MKRFLLFALLIIIPFSRSASKEQFIYKRISQQDGLSATVNSIYKELDGDVWIGSPKGLYRFNGSSLHHETDSLFDGLVILRTQADDRGNFWILTNRKLICRKAGKDVFEEMKVEGAQMKGPFQSLCHNDDGVWIGSRGKIYCYMYDESQMRVFCDLKERPDFICKGMDFIDEKTILCSSHNGMLTVDITTGETHPTPFGDRREVSATLVDSQGRLWIAFYNNGIEVFEKDGNRLKTINTGNSELSNNVILCMTERDSVIWAGTDGGGINIIDLDADRIKVLSAVAGDPSSLPAHSIKSIYTDHHGNIWAGSIRDGLIRISSSKMKTHSDVHIGLTTGLSNPTVLCLYQDSATGDIWIGTDGEGINRYNPATSEFTHFSSTLKKKVISIAGYSEDELALSIYNDSILIFNKKTGKTRPLHLNDKALSYQIKYGGLSMNLAEENDRNILLINNKVHRLDKRTGNCVLVPNPERKRADGFYLAISQTDEGIWLHDNSHIYFIPEGGMSIERKGTIEDTIIRCGHYGNDGKIWLATTSGLHSFNPSDGSFRHIRTTLFPSAASVVCDTQGRVWIGTEDHLYAYLTESGTFTIFGESDGAALNEYLSKPHLLSASGDVYLGGVCGLLCINGSYDIHTQEDPKVSLYSLILDNQPVKTAADKVYKVPRNCQSAEINVSTQETDIFRKKIYRYEISGHNTIETASSRLMLRSMPSPGTYDLTVSCTKRNGEWSTPVRIMTLKIPQPWYATWWFILSATLFAAIAAYAVAYSFAQRRKSMMQIALKEQKQKMYEEKVNTLINISHELRTPLTLIMAPLKRLLDGNGPEGEQTEVLNRVYRQSRRMKDLINMVLDLRKLEVESNALKIESIDFNSWIGNVIGDILSEEKEVGIEIRTEMDPRISFVEFDRRKCDTVMTNILINAVKHSKAGDVIGIRTELIEDKVRVTVSDQGPGLRDTDMTRLFTRFYQNNREEYGSGIGLSFSKILIELHGGHIGAANNEDKGASFWWEIPVKAATNVIPAKEYMNEILGHDTIEADMAEDMSGFSTAGMSLMLVDDNYDLLEFLKEALSGDFAEIILATGGNMAMKTLNSGKLPDVIVSDINMPDGDGFSLCKALKSDVKLSHIPVILLTARGEEKSQSDSYRMGADAYLAKPFEVDTLTELMRSILKRKSEIRRKYLDTDSDTAYTSNDESLIISLNKVISEHLDNPDLDQKIICMELGMSRASLYNKMKAITGGGVKEYITRIRIEKAKTMIETTNKSITEIAEMTGFSGPSYFSTAFKAQTGMTPSQYKQQCRQQ